MENTELILSGILNNFLITILSCIVPITTGIFLIYISKKSNTSSKIIRAISMIFESLSPFVLTLAMVYSVFVRADINRTIICILAFSICFLGYLPTRVRLDYSFVKNIVVNSVGLLSTILKWSFCVSMLGVNELIHNSQKIMAITFDYGVYLIAFLIAFFAVLVLKIIKFVLEETMK